MRSAPRRASRPRRSTSEVTELHRRAEDVLLTPNRRTSSGGATAVLFVVVFVVGLFTIALSHTSVGGGGGGGEEKVVTSLPSFTNTGATLRGTTTTTTTTTTSEDLVQGVPLPPLPPSSPSQPDSPEENEPEKDTETPEQPEPEQPTVPTTTSTSTSTSTTTSSTATSPRDCSAAPTVIKFLTYANKPPPDSKFCRSIRSQFENRIPVVILNYGGEHTGNFQKLQFVQNAIEDYDPCDYVVFFDAYDTLFAQGVEHITRTLEEMPDLEFVFGAECGCYPQAGYSSATEICHRLYPQSPTPYRWLNSGTWVARAWAAKRTLAAFEQVWTHSDDPKLDDQKVASDMFYQTRGNANFTLDYQARLFQTFHHASKTCNPPKDVAFSPTDGNVMNTRTGSFPFLLHFNGNSKNDLLAIEHGLWYHTSSRRGSSSHPRRLSEAEIDAHDVVLAPVAGVRDQQATVPFTDLGCKASAIRPHPQHSRPQWK